MQSIQIFDRREWHIFTIIGLFLFFYINELCILITIIYAIYTAKSKKSTISLRKLIDCTLQFILFLLIILILSTVCKNVLPEFEEQGVVNKIRDGNIDYFEVILFTCLITPIIEETIFRGLLYRTFKTITCYGISAIISSLIFSIFHQNILTFVILFFFSLFVTYIYEKFGNLLYPILVHSAFNTIMLLLITSS